MSDNKSIVQAATNLTLALIKKKFDGEKPINLSKEEEVKRTVDIFSQLVTELKPVIKGLND